MFANVVTKHLCFNDDLYGNRFQISATIRFHSLAPNPGDFTLVNARLWIRGRTSRPSIGTRRMFEVVKLVTCAAPSLPIKTNNQYRAAVVISLCGYRKLNVCGRAKMEGIKQSMLISWVLVFSWVRWETNCSQGSIRGYMTQPTAEAIEQQNDWDCLRDRTSLAAS